MTTKEHFYKNVIPFFNLDSYFANGYMGQDVVVATMESTHSKHGYDVYNTLMTYAPLCEVVSYTDEIGVSTIGDTDTNVEFPKFIDWCIEHNVDIISSSLSWDCQKEEERKAIEKAYENGIIFLNCAGNNGHEIKSDDINKPYYYKEECITIGGIALDTNLKISWAKFSSGESSCYGNAVDCCGLAKNTPVLDEDGNVYSWSGTSSATPMVAGLISCYKSFDKTLNSKNIYKKLIDKLNIAYTYKNIEHKIFILPKLEEVMNDNQNWKEEFDEVWQRATKLKVVDGTRPDDKVTRNELMVILDRLGLLK